METLQLNLHQAEAHHFLRFSKARDHMAQPDQVLWRSKGEGTANLKLWIVHSLSHAKVN